MKNILQKKLIIYSYQNENIYTIHQNLWDAAETVLREIPTLLDKKCLKSITLITPIQNKQKCKKL